MHRGSTIPFSFAELQRDANVSVDNSMEHYRSIRVHVLQMLLGAYSYVYLYVAAGQLILSCDLEDIVTSGGPQAVPVVESAMSLELLFEFIQHEDEETRIIVLKLLDVFLRDPNNRSQFTKMRYD